MSKFFTKVKANTKKFTTSSQSIWSKLKIHPKFFYIFILFLVCTVGLFYVIQTNGTATKGFTIMDLEERLNNLKEENKQLRIEATELESLSRIQKVIGVYDMKMAAEIDYVSSTGTVVAVK